MIDFAADAEELGEITTPDDSALKALTGLCQNALQWDKLIEEQEARLKESKQQRDELYQRAIPDAMLDCGLTKFTMSDGHSVEVQDIVTATPRVENREKVYGWLRENGFGDLIKNEVVTKFGAGDDGVAEAVLLYLEEQHLDASRKTTVHPQTLNAFVREQLRNGVPIPEDIFGVYRGQMAKIK